MARPERGQLSMRPTRAVLDRLRDRARLSGQRHTTIAERYLEEGLLMEEHPGIHFVEGPLGRRPAVIGARLDVWEIVQVLRDNDGDVAAAASYLEIEPRLVEVALRYYADQREAIDAWIARLEEMNEREEERWRAARAAFAR
jgi:uncharacterized protein (DUF433 family)